MSTLAWRSKALSVLLMLFTVPRVSLGTWYHLGPGGTSSQQSNEELYSMTWSRRCTDPGGPANGGRMNTYNGFFPLGSIVEFYCDRGYKLNGAWVIECVHGSFPDGAVWSDSSPVCTRIVPQASSPFPEPTAPGEKEEGTTATATTYSAATTERPHTTGLQDGTTSLAETKTAESGSPEDGHKLSTVAGTASQPSVSPPSLTTSADAAIYGPLVAVSVAGVIALILVVVYRRRHREAPADSRSYMLQNVPISVESQSPGGKHIRSTHHDGHQTGVPSRNLTSIAEYSSIPKDATADCPRNEEAPAVVYESITDNRTTSSPVVVYDNVAPNLAFSRDLLVIGRELGRGAFGRVLLGTALGIEEVGKSTKVAIKTLKEGADRQAKVELMEELNVMQKVGSHSNIVKLLGYCTETDPIYVIVEYMSKGNLKTLLREYRATDPGTGYANVAGISQSLSRTLVKFAWDVAKGMAFLASQKCIHRDLAARNVLVGEDMVCKVSDFGLARDVMNVRIYQRKSQGPLPVRWMALECFLDDVYTTESDVWSFGILMWEIVTLGARPYPLVLTAAELVNKLSAGYRMPKPRNCKKELYSIMRSCWHEQPNRRPSFQRLSERLGAIVTVEMDYITFDDMNEHIYDDTVVEGANEKF